MLLKNSLHSYDQSTSWGESIKLLQVMCCCIPGSSELRDTTLVEIKAMRSETEQIAFMIPTARCAADGRCNNKFLVVKCRRVFGLFF